MVNNEDEIEVRGAGLALSLRYTSYVTQWGNLEKNITIICWHNQETKQISIYYEDKEYINQSTASNIGF